MTLCKITIPKHARVLLLEDSDMRIHWFQKRVPDLVVVKTLGEFQKYFTGRPTVDVIFLDHDLGLLDSFGKPGPEGTGYDAAKYLRDKFGSIGNHTIIHSFNAEGAKAMKSVLPAALAVPFGQFELEVEN